MQYKKSKYSAAQTQEMEMRSLGVLEESECALTIDAICERDIILRNVTTQKMSRVLNGLYEMGVIDKGKNECGRVVYRRKS